MSGCAAEARVDSPLFQLGPLKLRGMDLPKDTGWDSRALSSMLGGAGSLQEAAHSTSWELAKSPRSRAGQAFMKPLLCARKQAWAG